MSSTLRQAWVGLRFLLVMTVLLGLVYPLAFVLVGKAVPGRADGSLVTGSDGSVVGSSLIGQSFEGDQWFLPRPSAAGEGYDALSSSGSNLAADNLTLVDAVTKAKADVAAREGITPDQVPPDAVTSSGSGLDPHISPAYADLQVARIAKARGLDASTVRDVVAGCTDGRALGFMGEPGVNVLCANMALEELST